MLKFFQIYGFDDNNPVVLAHNAREAGEKFCLRNDLPYRVLYPEIPSDTSECFAHPDTIPDVWAEKNSDEYQDQIDRTTGSAPRP